MSTDGAHRYPFLRLTAFARLFAGSFAALAGAKRWFGEERQDLARVSSHALSKAHDRSAGACTR
jgi:hypothetical protein